MRQRQTHPTLRYRPHAHCAACGSGWVRTFPDGKRRCGACGKGLIRKSRRARAPQSAVAKGWGAVSSIGRLLAFLPPDCSVRERIEQA